MLFDTTDIRSNPNDQIAHVVRVLKKSEPRRKVFYEIHKGKKKIKKLSELVKKIGLTRKKISEEANILAKNKIIEKIKKEGEELAYKRDDYFAQNKDKIIKLSKDKKAMSKFPTKTNPKSTVAYIVIPKKMINIKQITIDDVDSFEEVKKIPFKKHKNIPIREDIIKEGLKKIIEEEGEFKDWGGETDDLYTNRIIFQGKRTPVAFGLKGSGTKGKLTPKKMGKEGDQIQRLFKSPSDVFIIQYWDQIAESIIDQMKTMAIAKSVLEQKTIFYGIIDGQDTSRLIEAYKQNFK